MREIIFRGVRTDNGAWAYGGYYLEPSPPACVDDRANDIAWIIYQDQRYTPDWNMSFKMTRTKVIQETVGQFTGLRDKNGKEIFEGDIVKVHDTLTSKVFRGYVSYADASFCIIQDHISHYRWMDYECEVVGNIHDSVESN